jgi:hypothetical protein
MMQLVNVDNKIIPIRQIAMTKEEQLRQANSGSPEDERLMQSILAVWATKPGGFARKRAMEGLIRYVQKSPQMLKSSSRSYQEALNETWLWLTKHIDDFDSTICSKKGEFTDDSNPKNSLTDRFFRWVRTNLMFRLRDLEVDAATFESLSLDVSFDNEEGRAFTPELASTEPDSISEILNQQLANDFTVKLEKYLEEDPESRMLACHLTQHPQCNCYELVKRLLLAVPPMRKTAVAKELNVNYDAMNSHWNRKCRKILQEISYEIANSLGYDLNR